MIAAAAAVLPALDLPALQERTRRRVVGLVGAVYWLLIFEGALRKWAFPQFHQIIFFIRDPFALLAILLAVRAGLVPVGKLIGMWAGIALLLLCIASHHIIATGYNPLAAGFGLRNYLLYFLLALVMRHVMRREDVLRLARLTLLLAIPMALLVVVQARSPSDAWINKSYGDGDIFTVSRGVVRTTGTYTFTAGMNWFNASALAFLAIAFYLRLIRPLIGTLAFVACGCAVAACLAVSGSRGAFVQAAITACVVMLAEFARPAGRQRVQIIVGVPLLLAAIAGFIALFFADSVALMVERQTAASQSGENIFLRMLDTVFGGLASFANTDWFGQGIGAYTGGGAYLTGNAIFSGGENEIERVGNELGIIGGGVYMLMRWALAAYLALASVRCVRINDDPVPLLLWPVAAVLLVTGQVTSQGTLNGYCWLFSGLCLAGIVSSRPAARVEPAPVLEAA